MSVIGSVSDQGFWIGSSSAAIATPRCAGTHNTLRVVYGRSIFQGNDVFRVFILSSFSSVCRCGKQHVLRQLTIQRCVRLTIVF